MERIGIITSYGYRMCYIFLLVPAYALDMKTKKNVYYNGTSQQALDQYWFGTKCQLGWVYRYLTGERCTFHAKIQRPLTVDTKQCAGHPPHTHTHMKCVLEQMENKVRL